MKPDINTALEFPGMVGKTVPKEAEEKWKRALNYWHGEVTERKYQKLMERELLYHRQHAPYRFPPHLQKLVEGLIEEECKRYALTQGVYAKVLSFIDYEMDYCEKQVFRTMSVDPKSKIADFYKGKKDKLNLMRQEIEMHVRNTDDIISKLMHTTANAIKERLQIGDLLAINDHITSRIQQDFMNDILNKRHAHKSNTNT